MAIFSFATEFWWIKLVYKRFPILREDENERRSAKQVSDIGVRTSTMTSAQGWRSWLRKEVDDWREFSRLPIFWSKRFCFYREKSRFDTRQARSRWP